MPTVKPSQKVLELRKRVNRNGNMDSSGFLTWLDGIDGAALALRKKRRARAR